MTDAAGSPVLDLDAAPEGPTDPAGTPHRTRTRPPGRFPRRRTARRAGAGAAVLAVLAAGLIGHSASPRSTGASPRSGAGAPTDSGGISARYQRSYERVHVQERTDVALEEFHRCAAATGTGTDDPLGDRAAATALCRSAYRTTMRAIYADLARAAAGGAYGPEGSAGP